MIRAIHIEKLSSLDTDAFLNALIRMSARRGSPTHIRSDNGSNFVGAERELSEAYNQWQEHPKLRNYMLQKRINWDFNPPLSSHMGGIWDGWMNQAYSRLSTTHGHIADCKL